MTAESYNLWGKLALEQGSARLAINHFSKANTYNHPDGPLHLGIALLEGRKWELAQKHWDQYLKQDSLLYADLKLVFSRHKQPENPNHLYYRYDMYSMAELLVAIQKFEDDWVQSLWNKIFMEKMNDGDIDVLSSYYGIFADRLTKEAKNQYELFVEALSELDQGPNLLARLFSEADLNDSTISEFNPFLAWPMVTMLKKSDLNDDSVYNVLQNALEINPYSIIILKSYARQAIEMGLYNYAENALLRLYELLPREDYTKFEQEFVDLKDERMRRTVWSQ